MEEASFRGTKWNWLFNPTVHTRVYMDTGLSWLFKLPCWQFVKQTNWSHTISSVCRNLEKKIRSEDSPEELQRAFRNLERIYKDPQSLRIMRVTKGDVRNIQTYIYILYKRIKRFLPVLSSERTLEDTLEYSVLW